MNAFFSRYSTPFITGLFIVSLVSGAALFFHLGNGLFNEMHEWLSMVLIVPFVLHIWKNWRAFITYFRRPPMTIALVISLLAAGVFAYGALQNPVGGPPQFQIAQKVLNAPVASVAPLFAETPDAMTARLKAAGFTAADATLTLSDIATKSGKDSREIAMALIAK